MYAVIMAGGSGTRFWPLSREKMPKQLLNICGDDTLIQQTVDRILPLVDRKNVLIVANQTLADDIDTQLKMKFGGSWDNHFIIEPDARNTAPAIGLAALHLERIDPDSIMVVLSADHAIQHTDAFLDLLRRAGDVAQDDHLVTLGIVPTRPETGYGYIKAGDKIAESREHGAEGGDHGITSITEKPLTIALSSSHTTDGSSLIAHGEVFRVDAFVEKPDRATAQKYLEAGGYFWNSGMFVWKTKTLLREIERYAPALYQGLAEIRKDIGTDRESDTVRAVFKKLQHLSIDYAVMEKTDRAAVIPADIGWSDVGSWTALDDVAVRDQCGNIKTGNVIDIGSSDSIIYAEKRLVAAIGLKDMVVVDTPDATLVCPKEQAQEVKAVVAELKKKNAEEHLTHRTVHRQWGSYTVLETGDRYKIKRIVVHPGSKLSHQMHHHRSEHWVVVAGTARVTNGDKIYDVHTNESTYIPISTKHRLENPGKVPLQIIEVQNGEYLGEDDIVRFDDDYKRHENNKRRPLPEVLKR